MVPFYLWLLRLGHSSNFLLPGRKYAWRYIEKDTELKLCFESGSCSSVTGGSTNKWINKIIMEFCWYWKLQMYQNPSNNWGFTRKNSSENVHFCVTNVTQRWCPNSTTCLNCDKPGSMDIIFSGSIPNLKLQKPRKIWIFCLHKSLSIQQFLQGKKLNKQTKIVFLSLWTWSESRWNNDDSTCCPAMGN